jgi:peptidoglycan/LPS O-acetylase OafA/YrhL
MLDFGVFMDANAKRYYKEFGGAMAAYSAMVPISMWLLRHHEHTVLGYCIAFLPIIPSAFAMWGFLRFFRGLDELQRKIQFEAVAFSFLATCLITLTWAFQQNAGLPRFDVSFVAPLLIALWGIGLCIAKRRYE